MILTPIVGVTNQNPDILLHSLKTVNWRVAEIQQKIIHLNSRNQLKVIVSQIFSKELTEHRNNTLIKRKEYLRLHPDLQIKLNYPETLKSHQKGQSNKWLIWEEF